MAGKTIGLLAVIGIGAAFTAYFLNPTESPPSYQTAEIDRGDLESVITATGTVRPVVTTNVSTQVSGQVAEVLADFNDAVARGQVLARLDPQTFKALLREAEAELEVARAELAGHESAILKARAQLQQKEAGLDVAGSEAADARARLEHARRTAERRRSLANRGGVSDSDLQEAETELASAQARLRAAEGELQAADAVIAASRAEVAMASAQADHGRATIRKREATLEEARVNLSRTEIRAPLDGIVIRREVEEGQTVAASLQAPTLFTLVQDLTRMRIETHVDEADIGRVRTGQTALFTVDAYPGRGFEGRVTAIHKAPNLLQNVVTYTVLVDADNPDLALFPGMTAVVRVVVEAVRDGLRIPNAALRFIPRDEHRAGAATAAEDDAESLRVWVLDRTGGPRPVAVLTGASDEQFTLLLDGELKAGDRLITGYAHDN